MKVSIVIPIYNEAAVLPMLFARVRAVIDAQPGEWEVVLVNDGSSDDSLQLMVTESKRDSRLRVINFSRNFGHQPSISAGLKYATGDAVVIMDGDLQDPPELITTLLDWWQRGFQVVYCVRRKRKESGLKRAAYYSFYRILRYLATVEIPLDSGDFALLSREVVDVLNSMPEQNRFLRGLRSWVGYQQIGVEYERDVRYGGESKFTLSKLVNLASDGIFSFSDKPLRLAIWIGLLLAGCGVLVGVYFVMLKLTLGIEPNGWTSLMVVLLFVSSVQMLGLGIIGEYQARIYSEVKRRPGFVVQSLHGFPNNSEAGSIIGTPRVTIE